MVRISEPEEQDDATAFTDMLLQDVENGDETVESLEELQEGTAQLFKMLGKDPECNSFYSALSTTLYILRQ